MHVSLYTFFCKFHMVCHFQRRKQIHDWPSFYFTNDWNRIIKKQQKQKKKKSPEKQTNKNKQNKTKIKQKQIPPPKKKQNKAKKKKKKKKAPLLKKTRPKTKQKAKTDFIVSYLVFKLCRGCCNGIITENNLDEPSSNPRRDYFTFH